MPLSLAACFRLGYEPAASRVPAEPGEQEDASVAGRDASRDPADGGEVDANDHSDTDSDAGASDASIATCPILNACGGCTALPADLAASCGRCGLGQYVCDGSEALRCEGGDAGGMAPGGTLLIDDLEDGDQWLDEHSGLSGVWHTVADNSGGMLTPAMGAPLEPTAGGAFGSAYCVRVRGSGFSDWGAGMAVTLNLLECAFDASVEHGVTFAIKGSGKVIVSFATVATTLVSAGGRCMGSGCNDHFATSFDLSGAWTKKSVAFSSLSQGGWGTAATFSASDLLYIQFSFAANATFDVSVDDLAFY